MLRFPLTEFPCFFHCVEFRLQSHFFGIRFWRFLFDHLVAVYAVHIGWSQIPSIAVLAWSVYITVLIMLVWLNYRGK
mgnify:FL=1|jgi:hypothetical protein